jgi:soluble lytic murein transglycosylase-like protein
LFERNRLIVVACAGALALGVATQAAGAPGKPVVHGSANRAGIAILDRPGARLDRAAAVAVYESAYKRAKKAGVAPKRNLATVAGTSTAKLRHQARELKQSFGSGAGATSVSSPESYGVSQSTLDAIAACESGGDPTAVSPDGTYRGKYQFDYGTWASMGGSGDPAAAPEAEQDMRAAQLYASAGSSPWPVCG